MLMTLLGALVLAVAVAGMVSLAFRLARRPVPRGTLPLAAGLALVSFMAWNDYSWFSRTAAELPDDVVVAKTYTFRNFIQPWTMIVPRINRFAAVDLGSIRRNEAAPGVVLVNVYLAARYSPALTTTQFYDCNEGRRADATDSLEFGSDGLPVNADWVALEDDDSFLATVCAKTG